MSTTERLCVIRIGIDPHKSSLTAVALKSPGRLVASLRMAMTTATLSQLLEWAGQWDRRQWAVEGAAGLGRGRHLPGT